MTDERRDIAELLPFYVNGTLDDEDRRRVEAALHADPDLGRELNTLHRLRSEMKAQSLEGSPGELGLARLMRDIKRQQVTPPAARSRRWQIGAVAAACALVIATVSTQPILRLAGGDQQEDARPEILVGFQTDTTEADVRALLTALDLQIVSGPSALGLYAVSCECDRTAMISQLRQSPIVETAEGR